MLSSSITSLDNIGYFRTRSTIFGSVRAAPGANGSGNRKRHEHVQGFFSKLPPPLDKSDVRNDVISYLEKDVRSDV